MSCVGELHGSCMGVAWEREFTFGKMGREKSCLDPSGESWGPTHTAEVTPGLQTAPCLCFPGSSVAV